MLNTDNTCPFCHPNVSSSVFAETNHFRAIYNLAPILPGHSLIIPNTHISSFLSISDEYMTEMIIFSRKVIRTLEKAFKTSSFDWTLQEGFEAGQTIEHMHIHIIPRKKGDLTTPGDWYPQLLQSQSDLIDSIERPQHTVKEMKDITARLNKIFHTI